MPSATLGLIKPDSVIGRHIGHVISAIEARCWLNITAMKMVRLTQDQAKEFYAEHSKRDNFEAMTKFMASGPVIAMRLEAKRDNAWELWRMQLRDVREKYRTGTADKNSAHGSDSAAAAERELAFFGLDQ